MNPKECLYRHHTAFGTPEFKNPIATLKYLLISSRVVEDDWRMILVILYLIISTILRILLVLSLTNRQWSMMTIDNLRPWNIIKWSVALWETGVRFPARKNIISSPQFQTDCGTPFLISHPIPFIPFYYVTHSTDVTACPFLHGEFGASIWQITSIQRHSLLSVDNFLYISCVPLWPGSWIQGELCFL
jgi:hypothetical protein